METSENKVLLCCHCGNVTPHKLALEHQTSLVFDLLSDGTDYGYEPIYEDFIFRFYICGTCSGASLLAGFTSEYGHPTSKSPSRVYPAGAKFLPQSQIIHWESYSIPQRIVRDYEEIWPLRHRAPNAFVAQIRRLLEFICKDKNAEGRDLYHKLTDLHTKGYLPGIYIEMGDTLRKFGNLAAHADETIVDIWDAELVDEIFRDIVNYVYVSPIKLKELSKRLDNR